MTLASASLSVSCAMSLISADESRYARLVPLVVTILLKASGHWIPRPEVERGPKILEPPRCGLQLVSASPLLVVAQERPERRHRLPAVGHDEALALRHAAQVHAQVLAQLAH